MLKKQSYRLNKAARNVNFEKNMIFHSDRGAQYRAKPTVNTLKSYCVLQLMSRKGNCFDNAVAESFFKSLKSELLYGQKLVDKQQMKCLLFEYIEIWYRKKRRHSYLEYKTIPEFNKEYSNNNKSQNNKKRRNPLTFCTAKGRSSNWCLYKVRDSPPNFSSRMQK